MHLEKGILFVISGPSGVGKGTLIKEAFKKDSRLTFSVSATTRKPRKGECNGCDYLFVSEETFKQMIEEEKFLEWAHVHGNYYGTPIEFVEKKLDLNMDVVLDIDVQGALQVMKSRPCSTFVFIAPPGMDVEVLKERLCKRNTEKECQIENRLIVAKNELKQVGKYEYLVYNAEVDRAVDDLLSIIKAERCKVKRFSEENQRHEATGKEICS